MINTNNEIHSEVIGHKRTASANKNVIYSFLLKGINIATQFALIPIMLHYLDTSLYGIWLTVSSMLLWMSFFDIGIGNGLKIRLSHALASENLKLARIYISTAYASVIIVFVTVLILFWIINPFIHWAHIFNVAEQLEKSIRLTTLIVLSFACIQFITGLINSILFAKQKIALINALLPTSNLVSLIIIYILTLTSSPSLEKVALYFSCIQPILMLALSIYLFIGPYRNISPNISNIDFKYSKDLLGLGFKFLVVQFATLMVYSFSTILITRLYGPSKVTIFNLAYKYFTIGVMINGIICQTYWASLTQAYMKKDILWIRISVKKLEIITFILMGITFISVWFADPIMDLWVGKEYRIPTFLKITMSIAASVSLLSTPQNMVVNGAGKMQLQFLIAIISILCFIPISLFFAQRWEIGSSGIIIAMIITTLPPSLLVRMQYNKIISGTATGLWNK